MPSFKHLAKVFTGSVLALTGSTNPIGKKILRNSSDVLKNARIDASNCCDRAIGFHKVSSNTRRTLNGVQGALGSALRNTGRVLDSALDQAATKISNARSALTPAPKPSSVTKRKRLKRVTSSQSYSVLNKFGTQTTKPTATDAQPQGNPVDSWTSRTVKIKSTDGRPLINGNTGEVHPDMLKFLNRR